jgi:hypothetical protein
MTINLQMSAFCLAFALLIACGSTQCALAEEAGVAAEAGDDINNYRIKYNLEIEAEKNVGRNDKRTVKKENLEKAENLEKTENVAKAEKREKKEKGSLLAAPKAMGGLLMGMTVGVPVRIARDVSHETLRMRDQMTDDVAGSDKPDLFSRTVGSYTGMAYGLVSGVIKGSIKGTERAIDCGMRKPFSKESVSLSDPN